jgi:transposase
MEKRGTKQEREARRFRGIALLKEGHGVCEIAGVLGVTPGAVSQWKTAYESKGQEGLRSQPHPGAQPKLSAQELQKIPSLLLKGPKVHGFSTELWSLERVATVIQREFGVRYHPAHVWRILNALGWSCQRPERRARERDDQAVKEWRQKDWPRIKKTPEKRAAASS